MTPEEFDDAVAEIKEYNRKTIRNLKMSCVFIVIAIICMFIFLAIKITKSLT